MSFSAPPPPPPPPLSAALAAAMTANKCQVKVMRLALTKFVDPGTTISSSSRSSLLQLPKVFEVIHAGQMLKCLARILFAPANSRALARIFPPTDSKLPPSELGASAGEGQIDLLIQGRLQHAGLHELVLTCYGREAGECLRKQFRIDVSPSLAYSASPTVDVLQAGELLVTFLLRNFSKTAVICLTSAQLECDAVLETTCYLDEDVCLAPQDAYSLVFKMKTSPGNHSAKLLVRFSCGLGEDCELFFPALELSPQQHAAMSETTRVSTSVLGSPVMHSAAAALSQQPTFLLHGSMDLLQQSAVIPTRVGIFDKTLVALDVQETNGLRGEFTM